jgi:hypothetical protein
MDIEWVIEMLSAQWRILMSAPEIFWIVTALALFIGWGAAALFYYNRLVQHEERLRHCEKQMMRLQQDLNTPSGDLFDLSELRLSIPAGDEEPLVLFYINIFKWHLLRQKTIGLEKGTEPKTETTILLIAFNQPTSDKRLEMKSDSVLPPYQIKEFNQRFAIIAFSGPIPECVVDVIAQ